ncbi:uncharacterized protein DUF664 [Amycolatopsis sulphurea]|uniref:Uncharacterized protein DUF664 n=1 Tax=Amycolatopsis sulphurea TaxID=76022 RepID=A0A2A9FJG5_9PSEU|nr:DUF664 domain-containing protein [Amycolatopsis sulphurea]PFG50589.1 uncharacterized protein DUF664 [Amycolatopsis sulphurea]
MDVAGVLTDGFARIREVVHETVDGLPAELLLARPGPDANSISWLIWHLTRVQDDHIAGVADTRQLWTAQDWHHRFALPLPAVDIGYGHRSEDVAAVRIGDPELLLGYYDAVHEHTTGWLAGITAADLDRVVDEHWDPPVTLGVRLISVLSDDLQHAGQAAYLRGLLGG